MFQEDLAETVEFTVRIYTLTLNHNTDDCTLNAQRSTLNPQTHNSNPKQQILNPTP